MSIHTDRIDKMTRLLQQTFSPVKLEVIDDSAKHKGHPGNTGSAGHYTVIILAACFAGKSRIQIHREIYAALDDMIPQEIHALQIKSSIE